MKIGVVVPVLNKFQMAVDALASVRTKYDWEPYIIPNYREHRCLSNAWNVGMNSAIKRWCDYILIINDDILFAPDTIDIMVEYMETRSDRGKENHLLITGLDIRDAVSDPSEVLTMKASENKVSFAATPNYACFMLDRNTVETIGWFDEQFKPAYFEDNDYNMRIYTSGNFAVAVHAAYFYHFGSQTQNNDPSNPIVPSSLFEENRAYYVEKWGGNPGHEKFSWPFNRKPEPAQEPGDNPTAPEIYDANGLAI